MQETIRGSYRMRSKYFGIFFLIAGLFLTAASGQTKDFSKQNKHAPVNGSVENADDNNLGGVVVSAPTVSKLVPSNFVIPITITDVTGLGINSYQFNIVYDPTVMDPTGPNFGCSTAGTMTGDAGMAVFCNVTPDGTLRFSVFGAGNLTGSGTLVNINFSTDISAIAGDISPLTITDLLMFSNAGTIPTTSQNGQVTLVVPTAANTSVSGKVMTADGSAIRNARVVFTDAEGVGRSAVSNPFGYFRVEGLPAGQTYVVSTWAKGYSFEPVTVNVVEDLTGFDIVATE